MKNLQTAIQFLIILPKVNKTQYKCLIFWHSYMNQILSHQRKSLNPYQRTSSLQCGLFIPRDRSFTPESNRSLLLRSSPLRLDGRELITEDRASQLISERLQRLSLKVKTRTREGHCFKNVIIVQFEATTFSNSLLHL